MVAPREGIGAARGGVTILVTNLGNSMILDRPGQAEKREAERKRQQLSKKVVRKGWMNSYRVDKDDLSSIRLPTRAHVQTRPMVV